MSGKQAMKLLIVVFIILAIKFGLRISLLVATVFTIFVLPVWLLAFIICWHYSDWSTAVKECSPKEIFKVISNDN